MDYFEASRARDLFLQLKYLANEYWKAMPPDPRKHLDRLQGGHAPESEDSLRLREQLSQRFPEANRLAHRLGAGIMYTMYPPPAVGGAVISVNLLRALLEPDQAYRPIARLEVADAIDRCIGAATTARSKALRRLVRPWYWIIDIPATIARIPFAILRRAGLPPSVEEHLAAQIIKAILAVGVLAAVGYLGMRASLGDVVKLFAK